MKSQIVDKKYYLITHPDLPGLYIENYCDRVFHLKPTGGRWTEFPEVSFGGDTKWEISKENILKGANFILEERIERIKKENQGKIKYHWSQCQSCGDDIGLIGRGFHFFGLLHKCLK